jgi:OOP family OmpA-OmpF porin
MPATPIAKPSVMLLGSAVALSMLIGCGPIEFRDNAAVAITGSQPVKEEVAKPEPKAELKDDRIVIKDKIQFEYNSALIKAESNGLLNDVAQVIKENPQIQSISVEGHASSEGEAQHNLELSSARAKSVAQFLEGVGIPKEKLKSRGYGEEKPIADNDSDEGRSKNRRVEFVVVQDKK